MSELITVRLQIGVNNPMRLKTTVPSSSTVDDFRLLQRKDQRIDSSFGIVLIYNGNKLSKPDATLEELGICNDSLIICIISQNTGREIEALFGANEEEKIYKDLGIACEIDFYTRPFGFGVWANVNGKDAVVTKVTRRSAVHRGVKIGYCVYKVNDTIVLGQQHKEVLRYLKKTPCPVRVQFIDCGSEQTLTFNSKPLGFTVVQDKEQSNAKVAKLEYNAATRGVKIGSHIVAVNGVAVFGRLHKDICGIINKSKFPMQITFRMPPKLQSFSLKNRLRNMGSLTKSKKKKFGWGMK